MLPPEPDLEVRSRRAVRDNGRPPLLFVHGGYCDGWCWEPHFLPWFAAHGYESHALSLRGHGQSWPGTLISRQLQTKQDDYVSDTVAALERRLSAAQDRALANSGPVAKDLDLTKLEAGLTAVAGPGLTVTVCRTFCSLKP